MQILTAGLDDDEELIQPIILHNLSPFEQYHVNPADSPFSSSPPNSLSFSNFLNQTPPFHPARKLDSQFTLGDKSQSAYT